MFDLFLVAFFFIALLLGLKRPFFWVLLYMYVDSVAPQKMGWGMITTLQLSLIAFLAAFTGWLLFDSKKGSRFTFRQGLILALLAYAGWTTMNADFPVEAAVKWEWVWKALVFAAFLPLTLRTKLRIEAAVLTIVLSIGLIIINGGIKTVFGGGGYGTLSLLVKEDYGLYEGSILSTATVAIIPLVLWLTRHGTIFKPDWRVKAFAAALIFACLLIPVGTAARTGLVCLGVLAVLLLRSVKHRFLYMGLAGLLAVAAFPFLPQSYTERMTTIASHEGDESASTRVRVWTWTMDYAERNPMGGGFSAFLGNSFTYNTRTVEEVGGQKVVKYEEVTDEARAYHSSYFEMLGEQGYPGLFMWLLLQGLGVWQMERIRWRYNRKAVADGSGEKSWQWGLATALQQGQIIYLVGSLFVGIAFQPFLFMLVGIQCGLWSYEKRTHKTVKKARIAKKRQASVATGEAATA
ncbi:DUF5935 domain-containing protein [Paraurantiacibacter namhicola]|uniref:O-Antigen ligase n=1 Tax=Paraurantiacibacter namhicola TaxID=645517 RepID=A0A1C7D646_9SPHN|nr:DUF5935 domain-containing protein [Paraurantiacibacter namhicola]ANU06927.1 O-Antigen ligase [Paraurantiacibacter namhicola]